MIRSWSRGGVIGVGGFGRVYLCLNNETGVLFAMKEVALDPATAPGSPGRDAAELENEITVLSSLTHPHIVRYLGARRHGTRLNIFMEYVAGGTLADILANFRKLEEPVVQLYTRQLLEGLEYLHGWGYVHRDVKSSNILISVEGVLKLSDFGTALKLRNGGAGQTEDTCMGTIRYISPERLQSRLIGVQADIYAAGCVVLEMLVGSLAAVTPPYTNILAAAYCPVAPALPDDLSQLAADFL
eukprot:RCo007852